MDLTEIIQQAADESTIPVITAFLLGLLAAISPCPLATNISAMAYISREITKPRYVILSGLLYTLGRMASYFSIGALISKHLWRNRMPYVPMYREGLIE